MFSLSRFIFGIVICGAVVIHNAAAVSAQDIAPQQIRDAMEGAVHYLKSRQNPDGSWAEWRDQPCGATSLCALALLNAGVTTEDSAIQRAMEYLRKLPPEQVAKTYSVALQTMALAAANSANEIPQIQRNVQWLEQSQVLSDNPEKNGGWNSDPQTGGIPDNASSQYVILALYEAERAGAKIKPETWHRAKAFWENGQKADGSWFSDPLGKREGSDPMTCAGIGSLMIINGMYGSQSAFVRDDVINCCQPEEQNDNERIERGFRWLIRNFTTTPGEWNYYYLYCMERVGQISAQRFIGQYDWFREGVQTLLKRKGNEANHWKGDYGFETYDHIATAFALLFLSRGRRPVLISKGQYTDNQAVWSPHPNDLKNLTEFAIRQWRLEMTWQNIDVRKAEVDDLLQTPILFLCGSQSILNGSLQEQKRLAEKLRGYLDAGGFLFAEADTEDDSFDAGFRKLMKSVFQNESDCELRPLEPEHPVWSMETVIPEDQLRPMEGIDYGCRTCVIYLPPIRNIRDSPPRPVSPSLSCLWELQRFHSREDAYAEHVQHQIDAALGIGLNIAAYATGRTPKYKYEMPSTAEEKLADYHRRRGQIQTAMLDLQGNVNAAPRAVPKLLQQIAVQLNIPVNVHPVRVSLDQDEIFDSPILFLHGRNAIAMTESQRKQLKKYIEQGGFLFVNAVCSSKAFTESFQKEMQATFPDKPMAKIPANDPLLTDFCGGFPLQTLNVRMREKTEERRNRFVTQPLPPDLEGIAFDGRWRILFSPYDISCAIEETNETLQYQGYTKEDAFKLSINAILYAIEYL
ncbi:MAG: DUF4159 domain-containing protein [Planctomycetaceae bacterium]|jgi:hypothetical protein|nr:DUF4159 domain-containing protein [Planctomycetaceae bacterium]